MKGQDSGRQVVAMMQTAEPRHRNDLGAHRRLMRYVSARRGFFTQAEMRPVIVVIAGVLIHQALQMALVERKRLEIPS